MSEVALDGIKKYLDTTLVLKNITFMVNDGEKAGIIGENGCGKTTVLKLIAGILKLNHCAGYPYAPIPPGFDEGWVKISKNSSCAYLDQIPQYADGLKVIDVLKLSFSEIYRIENELRQLELSMQNQEGDKLSRTLAKYSELLALYEVKGGYETEEKLNRICKGLAFEDSFLEKDFNTLSGGEKTTVMLGKLLIDAPDILLLDEPTNHLDMEAVEWLEEYIRSYKGIVIVVSHDRYFLDNTVTKIIEIENKVSKTYYGNYSSYSLQKEEEIRQQFNAYKEQNKKINDMERAIKELRDWAMRADNNKFFRRAASMQNKLDRMERIEKPVEKQNMRLNVVSSERSGRIVIQADKLAKSFSDKIIFKSADLLIQYGEKVALIGPNGSGKTSFIKMLLGQLPPDAGEVRLGAGINMAYLPQSLTFENEEMTILEYFRDDISILEGKAREYLAKFMFYGPNVFKKIKLLSGGEKVRLKLGKLLYSDINLLILDEPTNHLDMDSIESIEEAISGFKGTVLIISHDRYFINKVCDRVIAIEDHNFSNYLGNYDYYKAEKEKRRQLSEAAASSQTAKNIKEQLKTEAGHDRMKNFPEDGADRQKADVKNKKAAGKVNTKGSDKFLEAQKGKYEEKIHALENDIMSLDAEMEVCATDYIKLNQLYQQKEQLGRELEILMEKWLSLN